jgi:hypothetical protein
MMSEFKKIYLQPECCVEDQDVGRMWCQDAINDCEEGNAWTEYLLASDVKQRIAELEAIIRGRDELINNAVSSRIAELEKGRNDSVICFVDFCIEKQNLNKSAMEVAFMYWVKALKDQG